MRAIDIVKKSLLFLFALLFLLSPIHAAWSEPADDVTVRYYGSSTLLFDDGQTQILLDGFFSRQRYLPLLKRFSPDVGQIYETVTKTGVCIEVLPQHPHPDCSSGPRLNTIIPVHGHYDHAMDVGVLSRWSTVPTLSDPSIHAVMKATGKLSSSPLGIEEWKEPNKIDFDVEDDRDQHLQGTGKFNVRLIKGAHVRVYGIPIFPGTTSSKLKFPATIRELRAGTIVNVLIEHSGKRALIVPSAGSLMPLKRTDLGRIDTLFLSIGGLDVYPSGTLKSYWQRVIENVQPKTVYLIHWDSDRVPFDFDDPQFELARKSTMKVVMKILLSYNSTSLKVIAPPAIAKFKLFPD